MSNIDLKDLFIFYNLLYENNNIITVERECHAGTTLSYS